MSQNDPKRTSRRPSTTAFDAGTGLLTSTPNPQSLKADRFSTVCYLKSSVQDLGLPEFLNRLVPLVEVDLKTQTTNFDGGEQTTGRSTLEWVTSQTSTT
jgi:hypothetical protein